jgi:hypothetical protein
MLDDGLRLFVQEAMPCVGDLGPRMASGVARASWMAESIARGDRQVRRFATYLVSSGITLSANRSMLVRS